MSIIRFKAMKNMNEKELEKKESDLRLELAKEKGKIHIGSVPENTGRLKEIKKTLARMLTLKKQNQKTASNKNKKINQE
ncbi:MAG: 50S ribosomal protein L29 [archaeon]